MGFSAPLFQCHCTSLLYQSLRVKFPKNPTDEAQDGKKLTQYLWREPERSMPDFYDPPAK